MHLICSQVRCLRLANKAPQEMLVLLRNVMVFLLVAETCFAQGATSTQEPPIQERIEELVSAAQSGDSNAMYKVATMFDSGEHFPRDIDKALYWYDKAIDSGNAKAAHDLAVKFQYGLGVRVDLKRSRDLYYRAATQGFAGSQNNLGDLYERGSGVPQSYADAAFWYARAAERGEPIAYFSLATMYSRGQGMSQNLVEGYKWAILAVSGLPEGKNKEEAKLIKQSIEALMPAEQRDRGARLARHWKPLVQEKALLGDKGDLE